VVHHDDLARLGSMAKAKAEGKFRLEGKEYVVRDGDIVHVRFNV
jgi:ribosome-binding ATPase YchF (GTP1/OBG family)